MNRNQWLLLAVVGAALVYWWQKRQPGAAPVPVLGPDPIEESTRPADVSAGMQALAQAIALAEGFGVPGAMPTRYHNPGDLTQNGSIAQFPDDMAGWNALYKQLGFIVSERSRVYELDDTLSAMGRKWTATEQDAWTANVVNGLQQKGYNVTESTTLREILA